VGTDMSEKHYASIFSVDGLGPSRDWCLSQIED
jgi:hypothetical protein